MHKATLACVSGLLIIISGVSADCVGTPQVDHASSNVTGSSPYPSGTVLRYDCNIGYTTSGTSRFFTCSGNTWTDGNIQCDEILCPYIPPPKNGKIVNYPSRQIGTLMKFECNIGHVMSGVSTSMCRADGQWFPPTIPPTCYPKNCGEFGSVQNADTFQDSSYTERNNYGAVVKVTCYRGYILSGSSDITCQADGTWGAKPTCEKITCPPYPNINSTCISTIQKFGTYIFLQCKEGENVSVTQGTSDYAECLDNGQWSNLDMACYCDCFLGGGPVTTATFENLNNKGFLSHDQALKWRCINGAMQSGVSVKCQNGQFQIDVKGSLLKIDNIEDFKDSAISIMCGLQQTTTLSVPQTTTQSVQQTTTQKMPETTTQSVQQTTTLSMPQTTTQSVQQTTTQSVHQTTTQSMPQTTTQSVPQTTTQSVQQTTTQKMPETTTQSVQQTTTLSVPQTTTQKMPETTTQSVQQTTTLSMPQTTTQSVQQTTTQSVHQTTTQSMPQTTTQSVQQTTTQSVELTTTKGLPQTTTETLQKITTKSFTQTTTDNLQQSTTESIQPTTTDDLQQSTTESLQTIISVQPYTQKSLATDIGFQHNTTQEPEKVESSASKMKCYNMVIFILAISLYIIKF